MTLIDKAEARWPVRGYAPGAYSCKCRKCGQAFIGDKRAYQCQDCVIQDLAALPARGVGVTWHPFDTAPRDGSRFLAQGGGLDAVDICSYNARVGCWDCGAVTLDDTDHEPEGYNRPAQWMPITALAPTDAAQAREAALREAAQVLLGIMQALQRTMTQTGYNHNAQIACEALGAAHSSVEALIHKEPRT